MKKSKTIEYDYLVRAINEDDEPAYMAIIPAFNNAIVFGDSMQELEEGIRLSIEFEIEERKKKKKPIPIPERNTSFTGKILVRISPTLHEKIYLEAKAIGKSLNKYIEEQLK